MTDNETLDQDLLKSFDTIKAQVKFLLLKFPQARSNDKILYLKLLQYFSPNLIYDQEDKLIKPRKAGWTYEEWMHFASYETCRRSRQLLQAEALKRIEAGLGTDEDAQLLPSQKVATQRAISEELHKIYYARN